MAKSLGLCVYFIFRMQTREDTPRKVDLINVGDELLDGLCDRGHLPWVAEQLARAGLVLRRSVAVRDDDGCLEQEFQRSWAEADIVITTGGMGPRYNDCTRETVARALRKKLVYDKAAEAVLIAELGAAGRPQVRSADLTQCWILEGGELLPNVKGTAPGIFLRESERVLVMLPGDGIALRDMFSRFALPRLREFSHCPTLQEHFVQVRAFGPTITVVEDRIRPLLDQSRVKFVTGESNGMIDIRLLPGKSGLCCNGLLAVAKEIREVLGEDFVCTGTGTLQEIVLEQLAALDLTLGVAESCTGGLLGGALTAVPGASRVFKGGAVVYSDEVKRLLGVPEEILQQHGAVSAEVAMTLATAVAEKFGTDYGLSVTGFAGPDGGTEADPIGTVYLGYSSPQGAWAQRHVLRGDREAVRARAVNTALDWVRRNLTRHRVADVLSQA